MCSRRSFPHVQVIYYIRRQDDWLLSAWQQWGHKTGKLLDAWVDHCLLSHLPSFLWNANHFQEIYGASSLSVVPMHRTALLNGALVADFYQRLGIDAPDQGAGGENQNLSINPYLCEVLAAIGSASIPSMITQSGACWIAYARGGYCIAGASTI